MSPPENGVHPIQPLGGPVVIPLADAQGNQKTLALNRDRN
jgi:hypothetical protein